jgi:hypothetical protein
MALWRYALLMRRYMYGGAWRRREQTVPHNVILKYMLFFIYFFIFISHTFSHSHSRTVPNDER